MAFILASDWKMFLWLSFIESECNRSCVIELNLFCLSFLCVFWMLSGTVPFWRGYPWIIIVTCLWLQVIFGERKCALENNGQFNFILNLWIVNLVHRLDFGIWFSSQGMVISSFILSDWRFLFTIWASLSF